MQVHWPWLRICLAKSLRDMGYPFDVKVSLLTRDRSEAVIRNTDVAGTLKKLIKSIDEHYTFECEQKS